MVTHKEALEEAIVEYEQWATHRHAIEACIKKYVSVRGLVMVPKEATREMLNTVYERAVNREFDDRVWSETYEAFIAAAPDPLGDAE